MKDLFINEKFEESFYDVINSTYNENSQYDYLVLFSGGKDSTYLAHLFKQLKGGRVLLFTVDNGFEENETFISVRNMAEKLKCDLYICKPRAEKFQKLFHFLLTEKKFLEYDTNPLCFFCSKIITGFGVDFAARNHIPVVVNGAAWDQLVPGQELDTPFAIKMFQMISRQREQKMKSELLQNETYCADKELQETLDLYLEPNEKVTVLLPFLYMNYDIKDMKQELIEHYNWEDPTKKADSAQYWSSGCKLVNFMSVLEKNIDGFMAHEKEQIKNEYEKGTLEKSAYEGWLNNYEKERAAALSEDAKYVMEKLGLDIKE